MANQFRLILRALLSKLFVLTALLSRHINHRLLLTLLFRTLDQHGMELSSFGLTPTTSHQLMTERIIHHVSLSELLLDERILSDSTIRLVQEHGLSVRS
jgi:hypothetical protein